jgi:hypothetical protein
LVRMLVFYVSDRSELLPYQHHLYARTSIHVVAAIRDC